MKQYLNMDEVIIIHEHLIKEFGGSFGLRDEKGLDSAVMRPQIVTVVKRQSKVI